MPDEVSNSSRRFAHSIEILAQNWGELKNCVTIVLIGRKRLDLCEQVLIARIVVKAYKFGSVT